MVTLPPRIRDHNIKNMLWRLIAGIGLALALAGGLWWHYHPVHPAPVKASLYENDMTEGLLRLLLAEMKPPVPPVCFLAFGAGRTPPSRQFLARFRGTQPEVRGCDSAASPPIGKYFDYSTGRPGLIVHIVSFAENQSGSFDVVVAFSDLPAGRNQFTYHVDNFSGYWQIKSRKPA